jgi:hypothetical protein
VIEPVKMLSKMDSGLLLAVTPCAVAAPGTASAASMAPATPPISRRARIAGSVIRIPSSLSQKFVDIQEAPIGFRSA